MRILISVSPHGWGHAARQRELVRLLWEKHPGLDIHVASGAPKWFWLNSPVKRVHPPLPSPIPIDRDGDVDMESTKKAILEYTGKMEHLLETGKAFVAGLSPDLVFSDVDPLPVSASAELGIPVFLLGNFTWDWIYVSLFPHLARECGLLTSAYRGAVYLRLPMGPGYSPCSRTVEMPLLPGGPPGNASRAKLLTGPGPYTLLAFREPPPGGIPGAVSGFTVASMPENLLGADLCVTPEDLERKGATFSDLMAGARRVVCKAGYGILSQLLAEGREAVILTGRRFPEEPHLMEGWKRLRGGPETGNQLRQNFLKAFIQAVGL